MCARPRYACEQECCSIGTDDPIDPRLSLACDGTGFSPSVTDTSMNHNNYMKRLDHCLRLCRMARTTGIFPGWTGYFPREKLCLTHPLPPWPALNVHRPGPAVSAIQRTSPVGRPPFCMRVSPGPPESIGPARLGAFRPVRVTCRPSVTAVSRRTGLGDPVEPAPVQHGGVGPSRRGTNDQRPCPSSRH